MKVWIAHITTESADHYYEVYKKKPNREKVIKTIWEYEGKPEDLEFFLETTSVHIEECEIK